MTAKAICDRMAYACAAARLRMHNDVRVVPEREVVAIRAVLGPEVENVLVIFESLAYKIEQGWSIGTDKDKSDIREIYRALAERFGEEKKDG